MASTAPVTQTLNLPPDYPFVDQEPVMRQPDISYHPNEEKWKARTERRLRENPDLPLTPLPEGFPKKLESTLVWEGKDWTDEAQWVYDLNGTELKEIHDAVNYFKGLNLSFGYISAKTFPLPTLGPQLRKLSHELHHGRGFFVLRTIPVESYSREDNVLLYAGVSSYIANVRGLQDKNGGVLSHIKDLTKVVDNNTIGGPAYTTDKQVFHTDSGDVVSLFALEIAAEGGTSRISSAWRVYNELAEKRPDLIRTLSEPWPVDGFGQDPPYTLRPLLFHHEGKAIIQYARRYFTGFMGLPRSTNIPPITEAQAEALDSLHFLAERFSLGLNFQKGDIQYINNMSIFHARDGFRDDERQSRHLLRLWLHDDQNSWKLPEALEMLWKETYSVPAEEQTFPLEPVIRGPVRGNRGLDDGMDSFPLLLFEVIAQVHEMKSCHFDEMVREKRVLKWTGPPVPFTCQQDDSDRESTGGGCEPEGSSSDFSGARGSQLGDEGNNRLV